ncbi:unnamed protein product [Adineta steineri]|uniref:IRS-type PTB domain-containing protein n=1 Tax=Adineta steineri TaxID=433720 RepID=A0A819TNU5_9BILA|nr:unnamed protein product [Adineta steineri]
MTSFIFYVKDLFSNDFFVDIDSCLLMLKNETEGEFPEDIYICVNQNGLNILDANTKEFVATYPYYNSNAISLFLEVRLGRSSKKYTFDTEIGDVIGDLIDDYMKIAENEGKQED